MIGIVTLNHDTFTNPTLSGLIKILDQKNIPVKLFCGYQVQKIPKELKNVVYFNTPKSIKIPRHPKRFIQYFTLLFKIYREIKKNNISHIIAIDPYGLVIAGRLKIFLKKINIHYFSFEIFFVEEMKSSNLIDLKKKEIHYIKGVSSILIQDTERKRLFSEEYNISDNFNKWHLIPVSPLFDEAKPSKEYLRSEFGLKSGDKVYIHAGSIAEWAGIESIIYTVEKGLPKDTFIFLHNREPFNSKNILHSKLLDLESKIGSNLIINDTKFNNYVDYLSFLKIFDYGIAIYKPDGQMYTGKNIEEIGLASGKFSCYMHAGLPTLLSNCRSFNNILERYAIGELVTAQKDLEFHIHKNTLQKISSENCINFYKKKLNPNMALENFVDSLNLKQRNPLKKRIH